MPLKRLLDIFVGTLSLVKINKNQRLSQTRLKTENFSGLSTVRHKPRLMATIGKETVPKGETGDRQAQVSGLCTESGGT